MAKSNKSGIRKFKDVPRFDRPREKMVTRGPESLSNLELAAVLVGCGTRNRDLYEIAHEITEIIEDNFCTLSLEKLQGVEGIGAVRACQLLAAIEYSRRFLVHVGIRIRNDVDVLPLVEELREKKQEYFLTLTLDGGNHLIEKRTVFIGTLNQSLIHPREVFADALTDRAASIICVHNHPGGDVHPSAEDILITKRLQESADLLGIRLLDHIIIGKTSSFSFKNRGLMDN
ncbi:MAG: RadC family protein [Candidatus Omnitrophota bacterium]